MLSEFGRQKITMVCPVAIGNIYIMYIFKAKIYVKLSLFLACEKAVMRSYWERMKKCKFLLKPGNVIY